MYLKYKKRITLVMLTKSAIVVKWMCFLPHEMKLFQFKWDM